MYDAIHDACASVSLIFSLRSARASYSVERAMEGLQIRIIEQFPRRA